MLDMIGILFSSIMMLMVIVRALRLDRTTPWFSVVKSPQDSDPARRPERRPR